MVLNNEQFEILLKDAVCEYHIEELKEIPSNDVLKASYTLSDEFYRKMNKLINNQKIMERRRNIKHILKYAAVVVLMAGAIALTNSDVRAKIKEIFFEIFEEYGVISYNNEVGNGEDLSQDFSLELGYVPAGYEKTEEIGTSNVVNIYYYNDKEETLFVRYYLISVEEAQVITDSEDSTYEKININNKYDGYFRDTQNDDKENNLIYHDGTVNCSISITANLSKEELIKIAENITY